MGDDGKGEELCNLCDSESEEPSLDKVKELVAAGANVDWKDDHGDTALFIACYRGHACVVEYLVTVKGTDINTKSNNGFTLQLFKLHLPTSQRLSAYCKCQAAFKHGCSITMMPLQPMLL